jgi:hypothetical protein
MRAFATSLLEGIGVALVAVGTFIISPALSAIVTGIVLVCAGYLLGGDL